MIDLSIINQPAELIGEHQDVKVEEPDDVDIEGQNEPEPDDLDEPEPMFDDDDRKTLVMNGYHFPKWDGQQNVTFKRITANNCGFFTIKFATRADGKIDISFHENSNSGLFWLSGVTTLTGEKTVADCMMIDDSSGKSYKSRKATRLVFCRDPTELDE